MSLSTLRWRTRCVLATSECCHSRVNGGEAPPAASEAVVRGVEIPSEVPAGPIDCLTQRAVETVGIDDLAAVQGEHLPRLGVHGVPGALVFVGPQGHGQPGAPAFRGVCCSIG